jgi:hypothetical protein
MGNYIQPDFRTPVTPGVSVQIENTLNPLVIVAPVPKYLQPLDHPLAPIGGQLNNTPLGRSRHAFADGRSVST